MGSASHSPFLPNQVTLQLHFRCSWAPSSSAKSFHRMSSDESRGGLLSSSPSSKVEGCMIFVLYTWFARVALSARSVFMIIDCLVADWKQSFWPVDQFETPEWWSLLHIFHDCRIDIVCAHYICRSHALYRLISRTDMSKIIGDKWWWHSSNTVSTACIVSRRIRVSEEAHLGDWSPTTRL